MIVFHIVYIFVVMKTLPSVQALETAFQTIVEGEKDLLQKSQEFLLEASQRAGFITRLLLILNKPSVSESVKQIALMHFTRRLKTQWKSNTKIHEYEKQIVMKQILNTCFRCQMRLIKPYRQVISFIVKHQYQNWPIGHLLAYKLEQPKNTGYFFHYLLAIPKCFEYCHLQEERIFFSNFLINFLPTMLDIVNQYRIKELVYLSIKFIWKAVHFDVSAEVRTLVCDWMPLICSAVGATNPEFDRFPEDVQRKHSEEFYYFHTKKWATRIFLRFIQKHAKVAIDARNDNRIFSDFWYVNYGRELVASLVNQMSIKTTNKIRCLQLKCLYSLTFERPEVVERYAEFLQYKVLNQFIRLQPEDQEFANAGPENFIRMEQSGEGNTQIVKIAAIETWTAFSNLGMINQRQQTFEPGVFFYQNVSYIQSRLQCNDPIEKQLCMRLMCSLHSSITKSVQTNKILPILLIKYIIPEFKSPIMLLRARTVDIFTYYGRYLTNNQIIKAAAKGIYICLTQDYHPLVNIKAAIALNSILSHRNAQEFFRPLLQNIISVFNRLLQNYQLEQLIASLEIIIKVFHKEISSFAVELINIISKVFLKVFCQDVQNGNQQDYDGESQIAATDCIKLIKLLIQLYMPAEMINQMESVVISIAELTLVGYDSFCAEECIELLDLYLQKTKTMSGEMWFICQTVVFAIVGITSEISPILDDLPLGSMKIQLWKQTIHERSIKLQSCFQFLRSCIKKISQMKGQPNFQAITVNFISLLLYLFEQIYKSSKSSAQPQLQSNYTSICTKLMIYTLENFQSTLHGQFYNQIWNYFKINLQLPQESLKIVNSQLLALLLWAAPKQTLTLAYQQDFIHRVLLEITHYQQNYKNIKERSRVILGFVSLIQNAGESAEVFGEISYLIDLGLAMLLKNAIEKSNQKRVILYSEEEDNHDSDDNAEIIAFSSEDSQNDNQNPTYNSPLALIDQQEEFINTIEKVIHLVTQDDQVVIYQKIQILRNI